MNSRDIEPFEELILWLPFSALVANPEENCFAGPLVEADQHSTSAAHVFLELVEKLSIEDTGEILLQPLGFNTIILDVLMDRALDVTASASRRRACARLICFLLRRAAEPEIMCMLPNSPGAPPVPTIVPNRLFPLRERIIYHMETKMDKLFESILAYGDPVSTPNPSAPVSYSAYQVEQPFGAIRSLLIEVMTLMVESDESIANVIPLNLWGFIFDWTLVYAYNNIFHSFVYRLVFAVLRLP